jgi:hypothetical protein
VADVPSGLSLTPLKQNKTKQTNKKKYKGKGDGLSNSMNVEVAYSS